MTLIHDHHYLDALYERGISYFSYSLLKGDRPYLSYASSPMWLEVYKGRYSVLPPVQKYIMSSRLKVLFWEKTEIDAVARQFIHERNDVVDAASNVTFINRFNGHLAALTFSSKNGEEHIVRFVERDAQFLMGMCQHYNNLFNATLKSGSQTTDA